MNRQWKNNPNLRGIDENKLEFLTEMVAETQGANKDTLAPLLLNLAGKANSKGVKFSENETDLLINALSTNMSPQELKQLENIRKMADMLSNRQRK